MDKRALAKMIVKTFVIYASGQAVEKSMLYVAPKTKKFKTAEFTGAVAGWMIAEQLEPKTDQLVEDLFAQYEARKALNS